MKKHNLFLSVLLVPAVILQAGNTCTTGGGPGSVTLNASVTGISTYSYTTPTFLTLAVSAVSGGGVFSANSSLGGWCSNPTLLVPGGGTNPTGSTTGPEDPKNPTGVATYSPAESYLITTQSAENGYPGFTWNATLNGGAGGQTTTQLTLQQEWSAVNWILNNPKGVSKETPTSSDIQGAIWQLLHPEIPIGFVTATTISPTALLTASSWALYQDALNNGLSFTPTTGQYVAVLLTPTAAGGTGNPQSYQALIVPVQIACTATGSATLTKSANVTSANSFQLVTYTYTIRNTGSTTLQNIVVVDDNGTPNYPEDDVTITAPAGTTIAPGASYTLTSSVYLPISLFYQSGEQAAFDTLIPQVVPVPAGSPKGTLPSLLLTYLIDSDVTDNTYGTGASAGWAGVGGHTFAELTQGYATFALTNSRGSEVSEFTVGYLQNVGVSANVPSGYAAGLDGKPSVGGTNYIYYLDSTLADDLNDNQINGDTVNSPVAGTPNWVTTAGYKVLVNEGIFGICGIGGAQVEKNYLAATETAFGGSGRCGGNGSHSATYTPSFVGSTVSSTAWLMAQVCGCTTTVTAKACLNVKLNGCAQPTCYSASSHQCQNEVCHCTCAHCQKNDHAHCDHLGCTDSSCHKAGCTHNTIQCNPWGQGVKTYCF